MRLTVNKKNHEHNGKGMLTSLFDELGIDFRYAAVMVNGEVIRRGDRDSKTLKEGDRVEIVTLVGGG